MRALSLLYKKMGHAVMGCDVFEAFDLVNDFDSNILVEDITNHSINNSYTYIIGNTFLTHPLVKMIKALNCNTLTYKDAINNLDFDIKIAVSGSHGKTTTTKLLGTLLDSSMIVGDGTAEYKDGENLVFEACEYKNTFLSYNPEIGVVLNCDYDHVDFFKTEEDYTDAFYEFAKKCKVVVYNRDDELLKKIEHKYKFSFSIKDKNADLYCEYIPCEIGYSLKLYYASKIKYICIPFEGEHMIYNFLAAYLAARLSGVEHEDIEDRMLNFEMPKRRMLEKNKDGVVLVLDYAHHPTEIKKTCEALRKKYKNKHLIAIYEGHTLTRSIYFKEEIKAALSMFDEAYLYPVYLSRESDLKGVSIFYRFMKFKMISNRRIKKCLKNKDNIIVFMGAGKIDKYYDQILKK